MSSAEIVRQAIPPEIAGMVHSVTVREGTATIVADATGLGRSAAAQLQKELESAVGAVAGIESVRVALMADKVKRKIIAVGSGKGGVGKSTLAANLAVALARMGRKVGVVDADIYGPSLVMMLDPQAGRPKAEGNTLIPVESEYGLKLLSMAQLVEGGKAIAWRGPMVGQALTQMMEAAWDDTEVLIVDLPPGTGDVQLTMMQKFKPDGALIVTTPQDLALIDATRAMDLFKQAEVPVIGLIENMAGYVCPHCGEASDPFGSGGAEAAARALGHPFLGRVPLHMAIRVAGDTGQPPAANDGAQAEPFVAIAAQLTAWLDGAANGKEGGVLA